jgi:hypothetical protein
MNSILETNYQLFQALHELWRLLWLSEVRIENPLIFSEL